MSASSNSQLSKLSSIHHARLLSHAIPADIEHMCHEFLRITEVCLLERVSASWRRGIRQPLQTVPWHVVHCPEVDADALTWLWGVTTSGVKMRSLEMTDPVEALACAAQLGFLPALKIFALRFPSQVNTLASLHGKERSFGKGRAPLHRAASEGHLDVVKFLASLPNIDVNATNDRERTPMHEAASEGHLEVVKFFTSLPNIDVNAPTTNYPGRKPMHDAAYGGRLNIVKFLASLPSIDVNATDDRGTTPMHEAARGGWLNVVKFSASLPNIDVNATSGLGTTPMREASCSGNIEIVKFLASLGIIQN